MERVIYNPFFSNNYYLWACKCNRQAPSTADILMASSSPNCSTNRCVSCVGLSDLIFIHTAFMETRREIRNVEPHHLNEVTTKGGEHISKLSVLRASCVLLKIPVGGGAPNLFVIFFFFWFGFCSTPPPPKKTPGICLYVVHTNTSHLFLSLIYLFRLALGK